MNQNFLFALLLVPTTFVYIFTLIFIATKLKENSTISGTQARKLVHIGVGTVVIALPWLFNTNIIPVIIGISFILITYLTSPASIISRFKLSAFEKGHPLGTVYYAISFTILLFFEFDNFWIVALSFLPLVFGDAFANILGEKYGKTKICNDKSLEGTLAGFFASLIICGLTIIVYYLTGLFTKEIEFGLLLCLMICFTSAVTELISPKGLDNLSIPLINWMLILLLI